MRRPCSEGSWPSYAPARCESQSSAWFSKAFGSRVVMNVAPLGEQRLRF